MAQKAPGKHYRKKISLMQAVDMFPDDAAAEAWFAEKRWPDGPHCPYCGSTNVLSGAAHKTMPYRCREKECRKRFSVRTGTAMEESKLGYRIWALALYQFATNLKGVSSMKLHNDLGITQKSAWFLAHRIREAWGDFSGMFDGPIEADETYVGGKRKNMSNAKRKALKGTGRGAVGKTAVVGVKDRATNQVTARTVEHTTTPYLAGFVAEKTKIGATAYTDESKSYIALDAWYDHESVNHSANEYVRGQAHTNGMESFWSMLKRGIVGTFHNLSPKHLDRYVGEFSGRHNVRERDTVDQMSSLARGMVGKRLTYAALIADNGLDSGARS